MTESEQGSAAATTPPEATAAPTETSTLQQRIEHLQAELDKERDQATDYMKKWQYAQAELANLRRRHQQEREELTRFGVAPLAAMLLEVLDNFERAEQALPPALRSYTWINGMLLIHRQLEYFLQQHGLEAIQTEAQRFDPTLHEAISEEPHETVGQGIIIAEVQRGYRMHDRLLRPALVRVSQGAPPSAAATDTSAAATAVADTIAADTDTASDAGASGPPDPTAQGSPNA